MLCASLKTHHPEFIVHFVVADEIPAWLDAANEPFDSIIPLGDLGIPNLKSWIFRHSIVELATGIKPYAFRAFLARPGCRAVIYFDPDIVLFSRLDDLIGELEKGSILLTPHQTKPEESLEAVVDNEICSLRTGVFNLGFLAVLNDDQGHAFTDWWAKRLYYFCQAAYDQHLFTDQKWINLVPIFFDRVRILKNSRFNVATWNITTRCLEGSFRKGFTVDGEPLGFYHFSGFDSGDIHLMANKYAGDNRAVMSLIAWYNENTKDQIQKIPWAFGCFSNGMEITKGHRAIYRLRSDLQEAFPDPFSATTDKISYHQWYEWRAAIEHPDLVARSQPDDAAKVLIPDVAPRSSASLDWTRLRLFLRIAMRDKVQAYAFTRKFWRIVRTEGFRGIRRRLAARG